MTTETTTDGRRFLQRALFALVTAFPSEFAANARDVVRRRIKASEAARKGQLQASDTGIVRAHLAKLLAANRAMLSATSDPQQATNLEAKCETLEGDIRHVDRFHETLHGRAVRGLRADILATCEANKAAALNDLVDLLNVPEFMQALTEFMTAEIELALCGVDVDSFAENKAALLNDR